MMTVYELKNLAQNFLGSFPDTFWGNQQATLLDHLRSENPEHFMTWPEIFGTMFVADAPYIPLELIALQISTEWPQWKEAIQESDIGHGQRLPLFSYTSGNLVHQAYHLKRWQDTTRRQVSSLKTIVEVGGGYGAMCVIARRMGFTGRYIIIDLPISSLLQRYYLSQLGYEAEWSSSGNGLMCDLLIGLWSLSEMNEEDRSNTLTGLKTSGYLVAGCGELGIRAIEHDAQRQPIDHLVPNSYWIL